MRAIDKMVEWLKSDEAQYEENYSLLWHKMCSKVLALAAEEKSGDEGLRLNSRSYGQMLARFAEFTRAIDEGKKCLWMGPEFVAMPRKQYEEIGGAGKNNGLNPGRVCYDEAPTPKEAPAMERLHDMKAGDTLFMGVGNDEGEFIAKEDGRVCFIPDRPAPSRTGELVKRVRIWKESLKHEGVSVEPWSMAVLDKILRDFEGGA